MSTFYPTLPQSPETSSNVAFIKPLNRISWRISSLAGLIWSRLLQKRNMYAISNKLTQLIKLTYDQDLKDFITSGTNALFENRQRHARAYKYWPLFLNLLLRNKGIDGLKVRRSSAHDTCALTKIQRWLALTWAQNGCRLLQEIPLH
jgi:hypothetical protein